MATRPYSAVVRDVVARHPLSGHLAATSPAATPVRLFHFFDSPPLTADLLRRVRPQAVTVAGPHSGGVDLCAAAELGIEVRDTPGLAAASVAEYTVSLVLATLRRVPFGAADWRPRFGRELAGTTLGIVGLGDIGWRTATLARAIGMPVRYWSPRPTTRSVRGATEADSLADLLATSDVVTLHLRSTPETAQILDAATLARMKPDAILVNTARASLVDMAALRRLLATDRIGGAALDVFDVEPLPETDPLWHDPRVLVSPHMAWMTVEAVERFVNTALRYLVDGDTTGVRRVPLPATAQGSP